MRVDRSGMLSAELVCQGLKDVYEHEAIYLEVSHWCDDRVPTMGLLAG